MPTARRPLAILGAGSWGTALAITLGRDGRSIHLWAREPEVAAAIASQRENPLFLPGAKIPPNVAVTASLEEALRAAARQPSPRLLLAVPSQYCRSLWRAAAPLLPADALLLGATKGLEESSLMRMSEVARDVLAPHFPAGWRPRWVTLSGPTFAPEVARGDPTALLAAATEPELAAEIQSEFSSPSLRLYSSADLVGVELAAALKNVIAIAAGVCDGLGLGSNTLAALITRGLAEIGRLVAARGGHRETLAGLAGLGDLVLTCTGALSRNRSLGLEVGRGRKPAEVLAGMRMVAEGVPTTAAALRLAERHGVEMPITEQMHQILFADRPPRDALRALMERSLKPES